MVAEHVLDTKVGVADRGHQDLGASSIQPRLAMHQLVGDVDAAGPIDDPERRDQAGDLEPASIGVDAAPQHVGRGQDLHGHPQQDRHVEDPLVTDRLGLVVAVLRERGVERWDQPEGHEQRDDGPDAAEFEAEYEQGREHEGDEERDDAGHVEVSRVGVVGGSQSRRNRTRASCLA